MPSSEQVGQSRNGRLKLSLGTPGNGGTLELMIVALFKCNGHGGGSGGGSSVSGGGGGGGVTGRGLGCGLGLGGDGGARMGVCVLVWK